MNRFCAYLTGCFLLVLQGFSSVGSAPTEKADPAKRTEEAFDPGDYDYILPAEAQYGVIPFTRAGNLILIQATVDTLSGNFILDTGAPGLILNLTYFRNLQASGRIDPEAAGITGTVEGASPAMVKKLSIGAFNYTSVHADRVGLGHIENSKGVKVLGLLGSGLFRRFEMEIDYANEVIHLNRAAGNRVGQYQSVFAEKETLLATVPVRIYEGKILAQVQIGKRTKNFILDTGAETNILDSRLSNDIMASVEMTRKISLIGSGAKKTEAWYGVLKDASIGKVPLGSMEVLVTSLARMSEAYGRNIDGMLGFAFFSKQKVGINFINNELYLWK